MNKPVLLVDEKHVKAKSVIEDTVDGKMLNTVIVNVQSVQLREVLGKDLFNTIIDEVYKKTTITGYTLTDQHKELLNDYINPYLCYAVLVDIIVNNNYKITNKGVMKFTDNSASSIGTDELESVKNYYDNYLAQYKERLIKYLREQNLSAPNTDTDTTTYATGWFLEDEPVKQNSMYNRITRNYYNGQ